MAQFLWCGAVSLLTGSDWGRETHKFPRVKTLEGNSLASSLLLIPGELPGECGGSKALTVSDPGGGGIKEVA